jgi:hypothetical protein
MLPRDYLDLVGGTLLFIVGAVFAAYAASRYGLGTLQQMRPGMFPAGAGCALSILGAAIAIPAYFRSGTLPVLRLRAPLLVLLSVALFAMSIRSLGLIPAICLSTIAASVADGRIGPIGILILCAAISVAAYLIFSVAIGLPLVMVRWPF